jgi:hypothetical protein
MSGTFCASPLSEAPGRRSPVKGLAQRGLHAGKAGGSGTAFRAASGPALASRTSGLVCAVLGGDRRLHLSTKPDAGSFGPFQAAADISNDVSTPALAADHNTLFTTYATATPGV